MRDFCAQWKIQVNTGEAKGANLDLYQQNTTRIWFCFLIGFTVLSRVTTLKCSHFITFCSVAQ